MRLMLIVIAFPPHQYLHLDSFKIFIAFYVLNSNWFLN